MHNSLLDPKVIRMPDFAAGDWLNSSALSRDRLRGRVVLVDFWDYTCVNCLRTLPYLRAWHQRYADKGLTIIGVHAPEFAFARTRTHVAEAMVAHDIQYPVLLDNQYETWSRFANKAWPTKHLVDADGYIRLRRQGEGYYREVELAIQALLRQRDPDVTLPEPLPPLREEDAPGAVCYRPTPELYAGYQGGGLFGGGLGNASGYVPDKPIFYKLPPAAERESGRFYLDGVWRAWPEAVAYAGDAGGKLVVTYTAVTLNAVLAPSADPVALALNLPPHGRQEAQAPIIIVQQDGRMLSRWQAGDDVQFRDDGVSFVRVDQPRMYQLVKNIRFTPRELTLTFMATGLAAFAFTFTTCTAPGASPDDPNVMQMG